MVAYITESCKQGLGVDHHRVGAFTGASYKLVLSSGFWQEIYRSGGRKFGFINLGSLGCSPGLRILKPQNKGGCLGEASVLAELHNKALSKLLLKMEMKLHGFKYSLYGFNNNLRQRMNHPSKFGFKEGKIACCGTGDFRGIFSYGGKRPVKEFQLCDNPKEHVFWDSYHLTERVYKQMADQMWAENNKGPYNLKTLFRCL
ncbi:unnamed protein product [Ilex paraguariensis]|uniref:GDSL esterase/lipase 5 n=1 Tax=Ilex paraguariensis TaxID=185542 RepID=A0ABC8URW1_9AQUA